MGDVLNEGNLKNSKRNIPEKGNNPLIVASINNSRIEEREEFLSENLPIGKEFERGSIVNFDFPDKDMKKLQMRFNIETQEIEYQGKIIKLSLPKGASIKSITFRKAGVLLKGKLGLFSGEGEASYQGLIKAIDEVLNQGKAEIRSENGTITLARK